MIDMLFNASKLHVTPLENPPIFFCEKEDGFSVQAHCEIGVFCNAPVAIRPESTHAHAMILAFFLLTEP